MTDDVADLKRQLELLREAGRIRDDALRHLGKMEDLQRERWALLRRVIEDAGKQYASMRLDVAEEFRDQGAPLWMECILTVGVSFIPITALTGVFIKRLTKSTQKHLTSADRKQLQTVERALKPLKRKSSRHKLLAEEKKEIVADIKRTRDMVAQFAKNWDPELANALPEIAKGLVETLGEQPFKQDSSGRKMVDTDAPVVIVTQSLHRWVDNLVGAERSARYKIEDHIKDLFDIAISPDPRKEAQAKEAPGAMEAASKGPGLLPDPAAYAAQLRRGAAEGPLPTKNETALDQLTKLRNILASEPVENPVNVKTEDLRELQLFIESMIWVTTYDFTPMTNTKKGLGRGNTPYSITQIKEALLPEGLWKRLIERYIDPDDPEGKSWKDVGSSARLPVDPSSSEKKDPSPSAGQGWDWTPEYRLSYYFSQILFKAIAAEHAEIVPKLRRLAVPTPSIAPSAGRVYGPMQ